MVRSVELSENEDPGVSVGWGWEWGGRAEGKLSHGGFVDGEERLESHCSTLRGGMDFWLCGTSGLNCCAFKRKLVRKGKNVGVSKFFPLILKVRKVRLGLLLFRTLALCEGKWCSGLGVHGHGPLESNTKWLV